MSGILGQFLITTAYLLALLNPLSKVAILSAFSTQEHRRMLGGLALRASLVALFILLGAMVFGELVLSRVFRVEVHALSLAGGAVLCWGGFNALRNGQFFEQDPQVRYQDMALVPLACPMIAGPASITAVIALRLQEGLVIPSLSLVAALAINHVIMLSAGWISTVLDRAHLLGALIRITGLIVLSIGTQMALDGLDGWHGQPRPVHAHRP